MAETMLGSVAAKQLGQWDFRDNGLSHKSHPDNLRSIAVVAWDGTHRGNLHLSNAELDAFKCAFSNNFSTSKSAATSQRALIDAAHDAIIAINAILQKPEDDSRRPHARFLATKLQEALDHANTMNKDTSRMDRLEKALTAIARQEFDDTIAGMQSKRYSQWAVDLALDALEKGE